MKSFKFLFIMYVLCLSIPSGAQPAIDNDKAHRRYWYYRTRLINDFMKIGKEQGDCIVTPERNDGSQTDLHIKIGPDNIDITNQYLIALALEYKLLSRANQDTRETLKEIYHILYMINRLDEEAEMFWNPAGPQGYTDAVQDLASSYATLLTTENGCILREDMPRNYLDTSKNLAHYNYEMQEAGFNGTNIPGGSTFTSYGSFTGLAHVNRLRSSHFHSYNKFDTTSNYTKQDMTIPAEKYFSMFMGFMFLIKYIPDNTGYYDDYGSLQYFQDNVWDIKTEVRNITNRCHTYLQGNAFPPALTDWMMEYPDGTIATTGKGAILPFSYPVADMVCYINNSYPWGNYPGNCYASQDYISLTTGKTIYKALNSYAFLFNSYLTVYNTLAANFNFLPHLTVTDLNVMLAYNQAGSNDNSNISNTALMIPEYVLLDAHTSLANLEWADLMRMVLHQNGLLLKSKSTYANPIDLAPCTGPFNYSDPNNQPPWQWSSQDRNEHENSRSTSSAGFPGNYPGVDYMILHNLYYEYLNQLDDAGNTQTACYKNAYNLMDNFDQSFWPVHIPPAGPIGVVGSRKNTKVFQNLKSQAHIFATVSPLAPNNTIGSDVEYRAGKEIALLPEDANFSGFAVDAGSEFKAYISRYLCSYSDYGNGMRPANGSINRDYMSDDMDVIPTHTVESPFSDSDLHPGSTETSASNTNNSMKENGVISNDALIPGFRFNVWPNPNNGIFTIEAEKNRMNEKFSLVVLDSKGSIIVTKEDFNTQEFDLTAYPSGIYLIKISSSSGVQYQKKINVSK